MTPDDVSAKAADLPEPVVGTAAGRLLIDAVWRIERVHDLATLGELVQADPA